MKTNDLQLENDTLRAEIQVLKEHNSLLAHKLNARLKHPTQSMQEMADELEVVKKECELNRKRFVWALENNYQAQLDEYSELCQRATEQLKIDAEVISSLREQLAEYHENQK